MLDGLLSEKVSTYAALLGETYANADSGPYAIKPHSKTLEILGNLMINSTAQEDKSKLLTSLTNFTLLQFQPKILQRLEIKLHASSATAFLDLFREEAEGGLKRKDLEDGFLELPYVGVGKGGFNEGKLRPVWRKVCLVPWIYLC